MQNAPSRSVTLRTKWKDMINSSIHTGIEKSRFYYPGSTACHRQTDESGQQMTNGDEVDITYLVDEEIQQEDYATVIYTSTITAQSASSSAAGCSIQRCQKQLVDMNGTRWNFRGTWHLPCMSCRNGRSSVLPGCIQ